MVKAVLFGSLSTLTNLVDVERKAFNRAFETHSVDLHWSDVTYEKLLRQTGRFSGPTRVVEALPELDHMAFYHDLESHFRDLIDSTRLEPHRWTHTALEQLRKKPTKVALVTGAERQTVLRVLAAVYDADTCIHAATCVKRLPSVFDLEKDPWINPDGAAAQEVEATIKACPSGALQFHRNNSKAD